MHGATLQFVVLPFLLCFLIQILPSSSSNGNIQLMEEEIAEAIRACVASNESRYERNLSPPEFNRNVNPHRRFSRSAQIEKPRSISGRIDIADVEFNRIRNDDAVDSKARFRDRTTSRYERNNNEGKDQYHNDGNNGESSSDGGSIWGDPRDGAARMDSVYGHSRRSGTVNNNDTSFTDPLLLNNQNNMDTNSNNYNRSNRHNDGNDAYNMNRKHSHYSSQQRNSQWKDFRDLNGQYPYPGSPQLKRKKRMDLLATNKDDECLAQCVFANMQVVDSRGVAIRSALEARAQARLTSAQSRAVVRDQLMACFAELDAEAEEDGCSHANKLERCMLLQLNERLQQLQKPTTKVSNPN